MREVKHLLGQLAQDKTSKAARDFGKASEADFERAGSDDASEQDGSFSETYESDQLRDFIARQKSQVKDLQEKLELAKKQYKTDKAEVDALRVKDPEQYRKKAAVLDKVKDSLEAKITKLNQKIAKIKEMEKRTKY